MGEVFLPRISYIYYIIPFGERFVNVLGEFSFALDLPNFYDTIIISIISNISNISNITEAV